MTPAEIARGLRDTLRAEGAALVGFADLTPIPEEAREGFPRAVALAVTVTPRIIARIADKPVQEYADEYDRLNALLGRLAEITAGYLKEKGFDAHARSATLERLPEDLITPLPQKTIATRSGLGWIGNCALLVTDSYGAAVRLNSVLTDAPLPAGEPVTRSRCGTCTVCRDICPGQAVSGRLWEAGMPRADFFDAFKCRDTNGRVGAAQGMTRALCGKCIAHCPVTGKWLEKELKG